MKNTILIISLILITSTLSYSQILPVGFIPVEHNGSFAGMAGEGRVTVHTQYNFHFPPNKTYGYYASYDDFIKKISTGIALTTYNFRNEVLYDNFANIDSSFFNTDSLSYDQAYRGNYIGLAIAPKISIKGKYTISPSIKINYGIGYEKYSKNEENQFDHDFNHTDITGGLTINTPNYYIGYAVRLFNNNPPKYISMYTLESNTSSSSFHSVLEAGYSFHRKNEASNFSFTPQVAFHIASKNNPNDLHEFEVNLRFQYLHLIYGHAATIFVGVPISAISTVRFLAYLGWQKDDFRILLLSDLSNIELNLRYIIPNKDKNRSPLFM